MKRLVAALLCVVALLLAGCGYSESYLDERTETAYADGFNDGVKRGEKAGYWEFYNNGFGDSEYLEWACDVVTSKFHGENVYTYEEYEEAIEVINGFSEVFGGILGSLENSTIDVE
jgi:hypothetical protein